jgi:hydrogenase small subunit
MDDAGLYAALLRRGMSRRSFLQFSAAMAAALALPATYAPRIAAAVEAAPRLPVIWFRAQTCGGNTEAVLRTISPSVSQLFLETVSVDYHDSLLAASGADAVRNLDDALTRYPGGYVLVVEGCLPRGEGGGFCLVNGRPAADVLREIAGGALAVIAAGSCAVDGGVSAARNNLTNPEGIKGYAGGAKYIALPGCPLNVDTLVSVLVHWLTLREWPPLDLLSRPLSAYGSLVHNQCERRPHFEFGEFALSWGDEGAQRGWCLYKVGCKGPETMATCPTVRYGGGVSWNVRAGEGCIGCMTPNSWDAMGPAYARLPAPLPPFPNISVDTIGLAMVGGIAGVVAVHATGMSMRFKRRARIAAAEAAAAEAAAADPAAAAAAEAEAESEARALVAADATSEPAPTAGGGQDTTGGSERADTSREPGA